MPHIYPKGCVFNTISDIKDKKITIMGLGLNGGGEACVRFLQKAGAKLTVTDMKSEKDLEPTLNSLKQDLGDDFSNINFVLGKHEISDFENADCVIKNPGVKYDGNKFLEAAKAIETDLSLFLQFTKSPIIAITGSKGKSSTVSAIYYGLKEAGFDAFLGGNITVSPLTFLEQTSESTPVVLELSSWQLADLRGRGLLRPNITLITKIVPDHQNWYGSMENYVADKKLIYADQIPGQWTICGTDSWGDIFASETKGNVLRYSTNPQTQGELPLGGWLDAEGRGWISLPTKQFPNFAPNTAGIRQPQQVLDSLLVPGLHSKQNALMAAMVLSLIQVPPQKTLNVLSLWPGIPHRLEYFHRWFLLLKDNETQLEYRFFNDTAATVPEASVAAAQAFPIPVQLICGGTDKELDFTEFVKQIKAHPPANIHLLPGSATNKLVPMLVREGIPYRGPYETLGLLLHDLKICLESSASWTARQYKDKNPQFYPVVFSPGATSFGLFDNEFHRGEVFKDLVQKIFV